eukprot:TRINITY_DN10175_c0_g1_i1.p1 TRINITY_DN10175_c0_g1~~TRINITY_DN10175_c0_g1_i1.p1  ORF type:complete len:492 (+),score=90.97 TRINITY_DN10175_c0_g1_i1:346-1821(+)
MFLPKKFRTSALSFKNWYMARHLCIKVGFLVCFCVAGSLLVLDLAIQAPDSDPSNEYPEVKVTHIPKPDEDFLLLLSANTPIVYPSPPAAPPGNVSSFFNVTLMNEYINSTSDNRTTIRVPLADPYPDPPSSFDISIKSGANARLPPQRLQDARDLRVMPLLTIVSVPNAFEGEVGRIQTSAVASWSKMEPPPQIVLLGDAPGAAGVASKIAHVEHHGGLKTNSNGVPLLNSVLATAERVALAPTVLFVSCDTVLTDDVVSAMMRVQAKHRHFLIIGRRAALPRGVDAQATGWLSELDAAAVNSARVLPDQPVEYFVFSRGLFANNGRAGLADRVPALVTGRLLVDNWIINYTRSLPDAVVVDASEVVLPLRLLSLPAETSPAKQQQRRQLQPVQKPQSAGSSPAPVQKSIVAKRAMDPAEQKAQGDNLENVNIIRKLAGLQPVSQFSLVDPKHTASLVRFSGFDSAQWLLKYDKSSPLHLAFVRNPKFMP